MSGICGYVCTCPLSKSVIDDMVQSMPMRMLGNSHTILFDSGCYTVGLACGEKPYTSPDGRYTAVLDGVIYNLRNIRKAYNLSDCTTSLAVVTLLWEKKGVGSLLDIDGSFSFAIWDREKGSLCLARDIMGECPLYYYAYEGFFVFASTLGGLTSYPSFTKKIRSDVLARYLFHQYLASPDCIYEQVQKLQNGHLLTFRDGQTLLSTYWNAVQHFHLLADKRKNPKPYDETKIELRRVIKDAIHRRLPKEGNVCAFLSGGYDSSLVSAMACELSDRPIHTFTVSCGEGHYDETPFAAAIARHLGTIHHEFVLGEDEVREMVARIPDVYDEPFADSSQIPTQLVCSMIQGYGHSVLAGDGADEFFGGYEAYQKIRIAQYLDSLGGIVYALTAPSGIVNKLPRNVRRLAKNRNVSHKIQLVGIEHREICHSLTPHGINAFYDEEELQERNWSQRCMLLDQTISLPDNGLVKVERAATSYGLTTHSPFFSRDVIECAYSMPQKYKVGHGAGKRILKDLTYDYIPRYLLDREKHGFSLPIDRWLKTLFREDLLAVSRAETLNKQGLFMPHRMQEIVDDFIKPEQGDNGPHVLTANIWAFYVFQLWYRRWMGCL